MAKDEEKRSKTNENGLKRVKIHKKTKMNDLYLKYNIQLHFIPLRSTTRAKQINHCKRHQLNVTKSTTPRVTRQLVFFNSRIIKIVPYKYGYKQVRSKMFFKK